MRPLHERIFARVDADGDCWVWLGATSSGYGRIGRGRRGEGCVYTHRAVWEYLVGPVPDGLDLDHLCRVLRCCNPDHLEPVTRLENVRRGARRPGYSRNQTCRRGHEFSQQRHQRVCLTCQRERRAVAA